MGGNHGNDGQASQDVYGQVPGRRARGRSQTLTGSAGEALAWLAIHLSRKIGPCAISPLRKNLGAWVAPRDHKWRYVLCRMMPKPCW